MTTEVQTGHSLEALATEINTQHQQCMEALQTGVQHALNAGQLLVEAKSQVAHGEWGAWLEANVTFSDRTARGYMRVARELPSLEEGDRQRVADLSLRDTLEFLAAPSTEDEVIEVPLESLSIHPVSLGVYGEPDDGLRANLEAFGQLIPIDIDNENRILCGGRRYAAAKTLEWTMVKAKVRDFQGDDAVKYILISNDYVTKPKIVRYQESQRYKRFLDETPSVDSEMAALLECEASIDATLSSYARYLKWIHDIKQGLVGKDTALIERFEALEAKVRRSLGA